jgi:hypothetical protein
MRWWSELAVLGLLTLALGCVGPSMRVIDDPSMNRTIYQVSGLFAKVSEDHVGAHGNLAFRIDMYITKSLKDTTFYLKFVALSSMGWNVVPGDTLAVLVDGTKSVLTCASITAASNEQGVKMQQQLYNFTGGWYKMNRELLQMMANAKSVEIEIHSSAGIVPAELTDSNLTELKQFQEKYLQ